MSSIQETDVALFKPIKLGRLTLKHRVVLSPLTRFRAYPSHVPGPQQASYYAQRASTPGTLLITEATLISQRAGGYTHVPGIYTDEQIQAWKVVTDAVHAKGSYIFLQLWALGWAAYPDVLESHDPPSPYVSASDVTLTDRPKAPRPMTEEEIAEYIAAYAEAASNAVHKAGFDGVEVSSAHGYLPDQFLQSECNTRTDRWGVDEEGRTRFAREIVDAVVDAVGEDRVGIRLSPWNTYLLCSRMPDPRPTFAHLVTALRDKHPKMAYIHVLEPRVAIPEIDQEPTHGESNAFLREIWQSGEGSEHRVYISAGGYKRDTALRDAEQLGGMIAFGRLFIPNPDLPVRLQKDLPLTPGDRATYYMPGSLTPYGYNDWPFADGSVRYLNEEP